MDGRKTAIQRAGEEGRDSDAMELESWEKVTEPCVGPRSRTPGQHQAQHPRSEEGDECAEVKIFLEGLESLEAKSLEAKGHKWDVAMIQLGPDVPEVFFVPRISQTAKGGGLTPGKTYDLANGYDMTKAEVRKRVLAELKEAKPKLAMLCPPCDRHVWVSRECDLGSEGPSSEGHVEVRHAGG